MPMNTPYPVPITALSGESRHPRNRCENRALGHGEPPFADRRPPDAGVPPVLRRGRDLASRRGARAEAAVLPGGSGTGTLRLAGSPSSGADVSLSTRDGHLASSATARVGLADLRLFDGSGSPVRVKVLSQPQLSAVAGGTVARSAVRYTAPVYEVTGPAGTTRRLDAAGQRIDIPLPASVPRLSIGTVTRHVTATAVTAEAATLRVQLFAGGTAAPSLDLGVGVLQVSANAPVEVPVPVTARPPATLPLTGVDTGWLVGIGLLTAIGGRLLLLLSRRRTRS